MDHEGSSGDIVNKVTKFSDHYITRKSLNNSDFREIVEKKDRMVYLGVNMACITDVFESFKRTKQLFFLANSYAVMMTTAEKTVVTRKVLKEKAKKSLAEEDAMKGVKTEKNYFHEVVVDGARFIVTNDPQIHIDPDKKLKDAISSRDEWFKLECLFLIDLRLVLLIYRHGVDIEHLISVLKSLVKLDLLRVWTEGTTRGRLVLVLVVQFILSCSSTTQAHRGERVVDGKPAKVSFCPSAKTVVVELERYQKLLIRPVQDGFETTEVRDPGISDRIAKVFDRYDRQGPVIIPKGLVWRRTQLCNGVGWKK